MAKGFNINNLNLEEQKLDFINELTDLFYRKGMVLDFDPDTNKPFVQMIISHKQMKEIFIKLTDLEIREPNA